MTERDLMLKNLSETQFVGYEIGMFLDTHPTNREALRKKDEYRKITKELRKEFEDRFGPLTLQSAYGDTSYNWINSPWPWEK